MASLFKRLFSKTNVTTTNKEGDASSSSTIEEIRIEYDESSERPYIISSIYYLAVIFFIVVPVWFYTCSSTRYALPDLTKLEDRLINNSQQLRLHLDISVVQLLATNHHHDKAKERQSDYLRDNLPEYLNTSIDGLVYNLSWRIRRPTQEENQLMKSILKDNDNPPATNDQRQEIFTKLEENLLKIHKPLNRFRLFMYIVEEPLNSLICNRPDSYLITFERFLYLCPGDGDESLANLIKKALHETYFETVDPKRIRKILSAKTDLLVSLVPENEMITQANLSVVADKVHKIHEKNIRSKYLELPGILNIRLITQNLVDLLQNNALDKMVKKSSMQSKSQLEVSSNVSVETQKESFRLVSTKYMGQFFHEYESRLNKHSSQSVYHAVTIVPDQTRPRLILDRPSMGVLAIDGGSGDNNNNDDDDGVNLLEERDTNFILIADNDKSLVLGMRAIVRRIIGLKSANLCKNCLIRRDVFINKWELDAIVGALTILKLNNILISLRSISQQAIGIKIPAYVSGMVFEAHSLALKSIDNLDTKKPLEAYHSANSAYELAEAAFYDPSLFEALYFPDEAKYAIYLPLFLPLAFPIAMSILRLAKYVLLATSSVQAAKAAGTKDKQQ